MRLPIHDNLTIADLQERFREAFPDLRIEFYKRAHGNKKGSRQEDLLNKQLCLGEIRDCLEEGEMDIFSTTTVRELEQRFHDEYGLNVQVFRKEPGCSIQTTQTDKYTLAQQMELVRHFKKSVLPRTKEQIDEYDAL
ncbi:hypothetical protein [Flaviaesturariibacter amylovorans]